MSITPANQTNLMLEFSKTLWLKECGREDSMAPTLHYPNMQGNTEKKK